MKYFNKLKALIEETYAENKNKKVSLLCHSLGCPYTLVFLNKQTQAWKDKFILQWITLSGKLNLSICSFFGLKSWFIQEKEDSGPMFVQISSFRNTYSSITIPLTVRYLEIVVANSDVPAPSGLFFLCKITLFQQGSGEERPNKCRFTHLETLLVSHIFL